MRIGAIVFCAAALAGCSNASGTQVIPGRSPGGAGVAPNAFGGRVTLYDFDAGRSGSSPHASLLVHDGLLYGTTSDAYVKGNGTVFSIDAFGKLRVVHVFRGYPDGEYPQGGVIWHNGAFYGTTSRGGAYGLGTVFAVTPRGVEHVIHSFGKVGDGSMPAAGLVAYNGILYGTTQNGGLRDKGTVFAIDAVGHERVLHRFAGAPSDGSHPTAALIVYRGALYGTSRAGGTIASGGTAYKVSPFGNERLLHSFGVSRGDGANPTSALVAFNGELFGTTLNGGVGAGTVFAMRPNGSERVLYAFEGSFGDGAFPVGGLIVVRGELYGTTMNGGLPEKKAGGCLPEPAPSGTPTCGTVFKIVPPYGGEQMLYKFRGYPDGANPEAGLTYAGGALYGTTAWGGSHGNFGTVFRSLR